MGKKQSSSYFWRPERITLKQRTIIQYCWCTVRKLLENMVNNCLIWCLKKHGLLTAHQCGYQKHHSATDQLVHLENALQNSFIEGNHMISVLFNLEKAFNKMWRYNIRKQLQDWWFEVICPNLSPAFSGTGLSTQHKLKNGIPQGSPLSSMLSTITISGIFVGIETSVVKYLCVDYLALFYSAKSMGMIKRKVQGTIDTLIENANSTGFSFSAPNTKWVYFCPKQGRHPDPMLTISGVWLQYKYVLNVYN